jgi:hypothetical protein
MLTGIAAYLWLRGSFPLFAVLLAMCLDAAIAINAVEAFA